MKHYRLHEAVATGNFKEVLDLIKEGVRVDEVAGYEYTNKTPLALAVGIEDSFTQGIITKVLVAAGACDRGRTHINWDVPFRDAHKYNQTAFLDAVKDTPAYQAYVEDRQQENAASLWKAAQNGDAEQVGTLIESGVDPNIEVLLKSGRRNFSQRPIEGSLTPETFDAFVSGGAEVPKDPATRIRMIEDYADAGNIAMLDRLASEGFDSCLSNPRRGGNKPLTSAAFGGKSESVKWLLDHGADPNGTVKIKGHTVSALDMVFGGKAPMEKKKELGELLVEAGAKPEIGNVRWKNALDEQRVELQAHLRRFALSKVAASSGPTRPDNPDVASPEEALAAKMKSRGFAM